MDLQKDEILVKTFHHHPTLFLMRGLGIIIVSMPFFMVATFFSGLLVPWQQVIVYLVIASFFSLFLIYDQTLYTLDRLILTNKRILHIDWKSAFKKSETEAEIVDIQDIKTVDSGILSSIPLFNYGTLTIETSSSKISIVFTEAPNPDEIKDLLYHLTLKPNKIGVADNLSSANDSARTRQYEEASTTRSEGR